MGNTFDKDVEIEPEGEFIYEPIEDSLRVIQDKYKAGIARELDLEDVKLSLEIVRFNHKQAVYDYLIAKAKLDKAVGGSGCDEGNAAKI